VAIQTAPAAVQQPVHADALPRRMEVVVIETHRGERGTLVVRIGEGLCAWCGWGPMRAELGARGYCPSCAGPGLAVLAPGGLS
jgi:hypothetical protein